MVKKQQMRWSLRSAHPLFQIRTRALDDDFVRWYPGSTQTSEASLDDRLAAA